MADKKTTKHSGFEAPTYGNVIPKDYVRVVDKDGRVSYKPPKKTTKKTTKKK